MARLPRMIVLVVLAFLVETAPAHRKLRLASATLRRLCTAIALRTGGLLLDLPRIWNIRLPLEDAKLLLVRLLSLQRHFPRAAVPVVLRRSAASVANFRFIDAALRVGVVLDIALEGVGAFELLQF